MLTIDEIKDISFRRGRGYKGEDVDAFIDEVIVTFEQLKREKADLIRKMDILATRVEQYRADEETVRNALLSSQRVADSAIKEANSNAAQIIADAEAKAHKILLDANAVTAKQKEIYLQLKSDANKLRNELEVTYTRHMDTIKNLPTDAVLVRAKEELDAKYPTVEEKTAVQVEVPEIEEEVVEDVPAVEMPAIDDVQDDDNKFVDLKFGDDYDVDAE